MCPAAYVVHKVNVQENDVIEGPRTRAVTAVHDRSQCKFCLMWQTIARLQCKFCHSQIIDIPLE